MIKTLSQEFGLGNRKIHELKSTGVPIGNYRQGGIIKPFANVESKTNRIEKKSLENAYFSDPLIFRSINTAVQMISSAGFRLQYNSPKEKKLFEEFFENLGQIGEDVSWQEIEDYNLWAQFVFGGGWNELVPEEDSEEIIDINRLNPNSMDYARNNNGDICLDENQKPVGYTLEVPGSWGFKNKLTELSDPIPDGFEKVLKLDNKIFMLPKRIALIKLYTGGDQLEFWGLIEPAYEDTVRKSKIEEAGTNSAFQRWMSPLIAYVGDDRHPPTPQLAEQTLTTMKKMKHDLLATFPFFIKLDSVKGNEMDSYIEMLKSLRENQASSLQMPMPFVTGSGEATNRSTLNNQQALLEFTLNDVAKKTALKITRNILKPVALSKGLTTWPKLISNRVKVDELDDRSKRFVDYVGAGILTPEEVRPIIAEAEGIELMGLPKTKESEESDEEQEREDEQNEESEDLSRKNKKWKRKTT